MTAIPRGPYRQLRRDRRRFAAVGLPTGPFSNGRPLTLRGGFGANPSVIGVSLGLTRAPAGAAIAEYANWVISVDIIIAISHALVETPTETQVPFLWTLLEHGASPWNPPPRRALDGGG
jgi:hypothetical protein